jgi:hypothetical protein
VTVLVDHYEDDWTRLWWIRLRGRARVLDAGDEHERALALLREKYPQYREDTLPRARCSLSTSPTCGTGRFGDQEQLDRGVGCTSMISPQVHGFHER